MRSALISKVEFRLFAGVKAAGSPIALRLISHAAKRSGAEQVLCNEYYLSASFRVSSAE